MIEAKPKSQDEAKKLDCKEEVINQIKRLKEGDIITLNIRKKLKSCVVMKSDA